MNVNLNRRRFLRQTAGAAIGGIAFPYIIPARVLRADGGIAPSSRIAMAGIGLGMQGPSNMKQFFRKTEEIIDDATAARMLGTEMRSPWQV